MTARKPPPSSPPAQSPALGRAASWPADVAVPRREIPRRAPVPLCETRLLTVAEVESWLAAAAPGEQLVYCTGAFLPPGPTAERARALHSAGRVHLRQRRAEDCLGTVYVMVKAAPPPDRRAENHPGRGSPGAADGDAAAETILAALERCAARGREAYSDRELARIAGLATRRQACRRVHALAAAGRIAIETVATRDGPRRVVTVPGSRPGQAAVSTKRPKGEIG